MTVFRPEISCTDRSIYYKEAQKILLQKYSLQKYLTPKTQKLLESFTGRYAPMPVNWVSI